MRVSGFFFFKQKTAYERRISDWSSDVCSSDLSFATGVAAGAGFADRRALGLVAAAGTGALAGGSAILIAVLFGRGADPALVVAVASLPLAGCILVGLLRRSRIGRRRRPTFL